MPLSYLGGYFPPGSSAHPDEVGVRDRAPGVTAEATIVTPPTREPRACRAAASKQLGVLIAAFEGCEFLFRHRRVEVGRHPYLALQAPGLSLDDVLKRHKFAIGLPFLAMMISSPAAAICTSDDSCVFASYKLSVIQTTLPSSPQLVKLVNHPDVLKHAHVQAALPRSRRSSC